MSSFCSGDNDVESLTANRTWTRDSRRLTFCPPGPPERENRIRSSELGISIIESSLVSIQQCQIKIDVLLARHNHPGRQSGLSVFKRALSSASVAFFQGQKTIPDVIFGSLGDRRAN